MKIIYIHIPKTAGSSICRILEDRCLGVWLKNATLKDIDPIEVWNSDYLAGHFTREELMSWVDRHQLNLEDVKILTAVRHPFDQLQSNLNYPFELLARNLELEEPWMQDIILADPRSADDLHAVLQKHPWLLNLQWQFVVTGSYLAEALGQMSHVAIYPAVSRAIDYCCRTLQIEPPEEPVHENQSKTKVVRREVFGTTPLRELVLQQHSLDVKLFSEVVHRRMLKVGLDALAHIHPIEPEKLLDNWIAEKGPWP